MTKFNQKNTVERQVKNHPDRVSNYERGVAFRPGAKLDLYLRAVTSLVGEPKFYDKKGKDDLDAISYLVREVASGDPEFVLKLAAYTRNEMYLRSVPLLLLVQALKVPGVSKVVRPYVPRILKRADEIPEVTALYLHLNRGSKTMPNQFKLGVADAYGNFDAYQFAKYKMSDKEVSQQDAIRIYHPVPKNEEVSALFKGIRKESLPVPETWETVLSRAGQEGISKKEAWESVIPKMGYMAKLRNLRNIIQAEADLTPVIDHLINPKAIANSRQFPYRFWSAYKMLGTAGLSPVETQRAMTAVAQALEISANNVPKLGGVTAIFNDVSGSMDMPISARSMIHRCEIAAMMAAIAHKFSESSITGKFGGSFVLCPVNQMDSVMTNMRLMTANQGAGHSTNGYLAVDYLTKNGIKVDRIMVFSDMQLYDTSGYRNSLYQSMLKYWRKVNPQALLYSFDLAGYGTLQIPQSETRAIAIGGYSDRIFNFIQRYEEDRTKALVTIEEY